MTLCHVSRTKRGRDRFLLVVFIVACHVGACQGWISRLGSHPATFDTLAQTQSRSNVLRYSKENSWDPDQPSIHVWDQIINEEDIPTIHQWATNVASHPALWRQDESADSFVFCRPSPAKGGDVSNIVSYLTPLEQLLESILCQLDDVHLPRSEKEDKNYEDSKTFVEYWTRQEYMDLEIHSDIDEEELDYEETLRYPVNGHILYLKCDPASTGTDMVNEGEATTSQEKDALSTSIEATNPGPVGPTCIFPAKLGGWSETASPASETVPMATIPVVPGRLVRFDGRSMHGVPKPLNRWWLSEDDQEAIIAQEEDAEDEDEKNQSRLRSVILFNTWAQRGPQGAVSLSEVNQSINPQISDWDIMDGIELDEDEDDDGIETIEESFEKICDEPISDPTSEELNIQCLPLVDWKARDLATPSMSAASISSQVQDEESTFEIALMGTRTRRMHHKKYVALKAKNEKDLHDSLHEIQQPRMVEWIQLEGTS